MKFKVLYNECLFELSKLYDAREAQSIINLLFEHVFDIDASKIPVFEGEVDQTQLNKTEGLLKRLLSNEPIQYVLGYTWFYDLKFIVAPGVLIPRPETEELVDLIIKENKKSTGVLLDIGTGSGCIPVSIKKNVPGLEAFALDISEDALEIARQNALNNHCEIQFFKADILDDKIVLPVAKIDILVSNPPYVLEGEKAEMKKHVLDFEPHTALFVDDNDPLLFYKAIARIAKRYLSNSGKIYLEINARLAEETKKILDEFGFNTQLVKDFTGRYRFIVANNKN